MTQLQITEKDIQKVKQLIPKIREKLNPFMQERNFHMSNPQIFVFLTYLPVALAISIDKKVDEEELKILDSIAKQIDANKLDLNLVEILTFAPEPQNIMLNEEFNLRIGCELLYIAKNMDKYQNLFLDALKLFLQFDSNNTLKQTLSQFMDMVIQRNLAIDREQQFKKVQEFKKLLNIV